MSFSIKIFGLEFLVNEEIEEGAEKYVRKLLTSELKPACQFHNLEHTLQVVEAAKQLCEGEDCTASEKKIVVLSAWFHDTGFAWSYNYHEEESIYIASVYLTERNYPQESLAQIASCIRATKQGTEAIHKTEMILHDADMSHLASSNYFEKLSILRKELEMTLDKKYTDKEWFTQNLNFLQQHFYKTTYGKALWDEAKKKNVEQNIQLLAFL